MALQGDCEIASVFDFDIETETESKIAGLIENKSNNLTYRQIEIVMDIQTHSGNTTLPLNRFPLTAIRFKKLD
jgi:hypothetical protein